VALEEENHDLKEQLTAKDNVIAGLNDQITQLGRDADLEGRFVEIVRAFIAGNVQKGCDQDLKPPA
jgi:5,10-methylenetetrahydrofolate reductase